MERLYNEITIKIRCRAEEVPGWGHDPADMERAATNSAAMTLRSYKPEVLEHSVEQVWLDDTCKSAKAST